MWYDEVHMDISNFISMQQLSLQCNEQEFWIPRKMFFSISIIYLGIIISAENGTW